MKLWIAFLMAGCASAQSPALAPFGMDWQRNSGALSDVSFLLDAPAGKHGFVTVHDGHLALASGKRFRIWGVNITGAGNLPSHDDAVPYAAHLARFGVNCVRMHFLDRVGPAGILDGSRTDTRALDAGQMDKLDFFIAELKKRGIYVDLNLNVARTYKSGDGVHDIDYLGFAKALTYFDPRLLELQREYAKQLLTHVNPYTKSEYRHEPAVLLVELVNENSIVESWVSGRLEGKNTRKNPGTWTDITASYEQELTAMYQAWLAKQGLPVEPRLHKSEIAAAPVERFRRELRFYMEIEDRYFQGMRRYLKDELGVKPLLLGTSDHNHGISGYPLLASTSKLDVVDGHIYWQHPHYIEDPATGKRMGFDIRNSAMVDDPTHSTAVQLSRSAFAGKPYVVSEVNHPFPAEHSGEGIPILTAYAALQDWDGLFWYTFEHVDPAKWQNEAAGHFELRPDPVKMAELAAGALMFLRGDVSAARQTVTRSYSAEEVLDSLRLPSAEQPYFTPGFPLATPLEHAVRITTLDRAAAAKYTAHASDTITSDTNQLAWRKGLVTVDTPSTVALMGQVNGAAAGPLKAEVCNRFGTIILTSMDGAPIARSRKMLLVTGSVVANSGMEWNEKRTSLVKWGTAPVLTEPVSGTMTLRGLKAAKVLVTALDGAGKPIGEPRLAKHAGDAWTIEIGTPATVWYGLEER